MAEEPFLAAKSETGFQNFYLQIHHWVRNPDKDVDQNPINMF